LRRIFRYMKTSAGAALLVAFVLALSACGGSRGTGSGPKQRDVSAGSVSSSGLILGGRVRCTATATTPVQAGEGLGVMFALRNLSEGPVKVALGSWLVVRSAGGTTYDTRVP